MYGTGEDPGIIFFLNEKKKWGGGGGARVIVNIVRNFTIQKLIFLKNRGRVPLAPPPPPPPKSVYAEVRCVIK